MLVYKAHGCVKALYDQKGEFIVTASEMAAPLKQQPPARTERMRKQVSDRQVIAIGWSATEGYVKQLFAELGETGALHQLTIVDLKADQPGHLEVCKSFKVDPVIAGVPVKGSSPGTTDDLLLWIQTLRGCNAIRTACDGIANLQRDIEKGMSNSAPFGTGFLATATLVSAIDNWLPAWLRMCFFVRAQTHRFTTGNEMQVLPTEQRDAHIPWAPLSDRRDDLVSAASLIGMLLASGDAWDFESFSGALWSPSSQEIILPVPIWTAPDNVSQTFIRPLVNDWRDKSRIASVRILPLDAPALPALTGAERADRLLRWKEALADCFGHQSLASASHFDHIELSSL